MREAQLLILDKPTAALDARAGYGVFKRFSTVRMAGHNLVVRHGRVQEIGLYQELLAKDGSYAELFQLQAAGYR